MRNEKKMRNCFSSEIVYESTSMRKNHFKWNCLWI